MYSNVMVLTRRGIMARTYQEYRQDKREAKNLRDGVITKSMSKRMERKKFAEAFEIILKRKIRNVKTPEGEDMTMMDRICESVVERILNTGDIKAFESIRDTVGEKPVDKVESTSTVAVMPVVEIDGQALLIEVGESVN